MYVSLSLMQLWTMTIVDRSSEKSDHESAGCNRSSFTSRDVGMDGSCSSSWAVGPTVPSDSPRLKAPVGCLAPTPGAAVYNSTPSSVDRPKEQGQSKAWLFFSKCLFKVVWRCLLIDRIVFQPVLANVEPHFLSIIYPYLSELVLVT